jgi:hypothetical protein
MEARLKRVAILGNSHLISVSSAFKAGRLEYENVVFFDFWNEDQAEYGDGCFRFTASPVNGTETTVKLADFDLFVVCAGGWWAARNEHLTGNGTSHPLAHVALPQWLHLNVQPPVSHGLVSQAVFEETVYCWINGHRLTDLVRFIGQKNGKKVLWQPWPAPNRKFKGDPNWILNSHYGDYGPKAWLDFFRAQYKALNRISVDIGDNVQLLPYPLPEIMEDGFMDAALCDRDPFHGNLNYGSLIVNQLEPYLN